jgi:hypothetical protein
MHTAGITDYQQNALPLIGNIIRRGPPEKRQKLLSSLHKFTKLYNAGLARHIYSSKFVEQSAGPSASAAAAQNGDAERLPVSPSTPPEQEEEEEEEDDDDDASIGKYTTALKERGDQLGIAPIYDCNKISSKPSSFRASLSFQEVRVTGEGRNGKLARHRASKLACSRLGVRLN